LVTVIIGIVGAFIGDWFLPQIGIHLGVGIVGAIINATIGAVLLLVADPWRGPMEQRLGAPFVAVMLRNHGGEPGGQFFGAAEQKIPRLRRYAYALHRLMDMGQKDRSGQ
jgi:hypothetical protein